MRPQSETGASLGEHFDLDAFPFPLQEPARERICISYLLSKDTSLQLAPFIFSEPHLAPIAQLGQKVIAAFLEASQALASRAKTDSHCSDAVQDVSDGGRTPAISLGGRQQLLQCPGNSALSHIGQPSGN
jgi:hypothetical protein